MHCPEFTIERINTYGVKTDPHSYTKEKDRMTSCYEFRFFLQDWEGGPVINGILYSAEKGYFTCCKPMQCLRHEGAFSCYIFNISTEDPQLTDALNSLPVYAYHPEMDGILELFEKLCKVDTRNTLDGRLEIWSYANSLLRLLLKPEYEAAVSYNGNSRRHQAALQAARKYLKEHLAEDVDLAQLAKDSHLHPTYFHKLFTAAFGSTPSELLMWYRIQAAWWYLRDDNCSISEIARNCGFSSQSYFSRKFKQYARQTPTQYRNAIRRRREK